METGTVMPQSDYQHHSFHFSGTGNEFFRIWIVNITLSILTLGVYSAWAKVRTNQYFYSSTRVAGSSFNYLADPLTILKGRFIAMVFFVGYSLAIQYSPILYAVLMLVLVVAMPWIIMKGLAFNARMTTWRNVRFQFHGSYWGIVRRYIIMPVSIPLSVGLLIPWVQKQQKEYIVENYSFGGKCFCPSFSTKSFYGIYSKALLILILTLIFLAACLFLIGYMTSGALARSPIITFFYVFSSACAYLFVYVYLYVKSSNLIFNNSSLNDNGFVSNLAFWPYLGVIVTNLVMIVLTLGLATPWAKVRLARYRAQCMTLVAAENLDSFIDQAQNEQEAYGEELGEVFDLAVGL